MGIKKGGHDFVDISSPKRKQGKPKLSVLVVLVLVTAIAVYFLRPWFHEIIMQVYIFPSFFVMITTAVLSLMLLKRKKKNVAYVLAAITLLSFLVFTLNNVIVGSYIVNSYTYNKVESLPESDGIRVLPLAVGWRYLQDSLQKSREKIGDLDVVIINDTLVWSAPRIPDGGILYFTQKVNGLIIADAESSTRKTKIINKKMDIGEGIGVTDNIYWKLYKKRFFVELGDVYYVIDKNNNIRIIAPIIGYRFRFPVMVPYFEGVFVVDDKGNIETYSPAQLTSLEYLKNNKAFPEKLARLYVDSYKYNLGIINAWFLHKDQIQISDVYGQGNKQPFIMPTKEGLKWIIATEPYGLSYGVFKIFSVDAVTGKIDMLELNEDDTLTGPFKVVSYVKKKFPTIDWQSARIIEPRPYIIKGKLYWMLSITPNDFAGVSYTVLVDSTDNKVISFESDEEIASFIKGKPEKIETDNGKTDRDTEISKKIESIQKSLDELKDLISAEG